MYYDPLNAGKIEQITYEAYDEEYGIKAYFTLPANASIYEKRFEAEQAIKRKLDIHFRKKSKGVNE